MNDIESKGETPHREAPPASAPESLLPSLLALNRRLMEWEQHPDSEDHGADW